MHVELIFLILYIYPKTTRQSAPKSKCIVSIKKIKLQLEQN